MSSGSNFQKVPDPVSDPTFFLKEYGFKGHKMAFQNIIFKAVLRCRSRKEPHPLVGAGAVMYCRSSFGSEIGNKDG
jgi:hypothetical protein